MAKYTTAKIGGIIVGVVKETDTPGYTVGVIEACLPDEKKLTDEAAMVWIKENNNRMREICKFLNENNL